MSEHDHEPEPQREPGAEDAIAEAGGAEDAIAEAGDGDELERELAEQMGEDGDGDGDDELEGDGDGDDAPQPPPVTDKEIEQTFEKLDRETARHVKRVAELVGEGMFPFLTPCPLCHPAAPGFIFPGPIADDVKSSVRLTIGDREPENWQPDTFSRRCDACDGLGEVLTGSKVQGKGTLACLACGGNGWVPIGPERTGRPATPLRVVEGEEPQPVAPVAPVDEPPEAAALRAAGYVVIRTGAAE